MRRHKVRFSAAAKSDLIEIGDYIAQEDPVAALRLIEKIEEQCLSLEMLPERYAVNRHLSANLEYRVLVIGNYLAIYRIEATYEVSVIRVFHGARNYHKILKDNSS